MGHIAQISYEDRGIPEMKGCCCGFDSNGKLEYQTGESRGSWVVSDQGFVRVKTIELKELVHSFVFFSDQLGV